MSTPDSTAAFDADANRPSVDDLKAQLAEAEAAEANVSTDVQIIDADGNTDGQDDIIDALSTTVLDTEFRFVIPKPAALTAFGLGASNRKNGALMMKTMTNFLNFHFVGDSFEVMLDRLMDPEDDFNEEHMSDIIGEIVNAANDSAEAKAPKNGPRG